MLVFRRRDELEKGHFSAGRECSAAPRAVAGGADVPFGSRRYRVVYPMDIVSGGQSVEGGFDEAHMGRYPQIGSASCRERV